MDCDSIGVIPPPLKEILPEGFNYHFCKFTHKESDFTVIFRLDTKSEEAAKDWKVKFQESSSSTWRVHRTRPSLSKYVLFKVEYRCQHGQQRKTIGKAHHSKNTDCMSSLRMTVTRTTVSRGRLSRSTDPHIPDFPTAIRLTWMHNHAINAAPAVKHKAVSQETSNQLVNLFQYGPSPSCAQNIQELDLQIRDPEGYVTNILGRLPIDPGVQSDSALDGLSSMFDDIKEKLSSNPDVFEQPVHSMIKAYKNLQSDSNLVLALRTFGTYTGVTLAKHKLSSRKVSTVAFRAHSTGSIGVQPTAIARRKTAIGGKRRLTSPR